MKRIFITLLLAALPVLCPAQTSQSRTVEDGGTGPYKALMVGDASLPDFTIYRPADLAAATKNGRLPVILYGNGGCANSTVEIRFFLNELASHGYVAVGIGPYDDEDSNEHWVDVLYNIWPDGKKVILSNGREVKPLSPAESLARIESYNRRLQEARRETERNPSSPAATFANATQASQLLEAMDWLTAQNADPKSEYYHKLDLDKVAAMGQSCGGSQALAIGHDPRVKTCVILNSGIGDMTMQGFSAPGLANMHTPMYYLIGGPTDVAFGNAEKDFQRLENLPVVMMNTHDGHLGTYYERHGGAYAVAVRKWLDWQLKGDASNAAFFLTDDALKREFPDWSVVRKNWVSTGAFAAPGQGGSPAGPAAGVRPSAPAGAPAADSRPSAAMRRAMTPPSDPAYRVEEISVMSDGKKLFGEAFIPVSAGKHPAVILSHGYGGTNNGFYTLASKLAKQGYVCYCYDFAGGSPRSRSEGNTLDMSIFTERQNLMDVIDEVRSWSFVDKKNVFLLGESQGGCVSAITAPYVKKKINSILLIYPALCIPDDANALFPTVADIPAEYQMMGMTIGKTYYEPLVAGYDIYSEIARYQGEVLIVHGTEDSLVKPEYSAKASNVYRNCEMHLIFGAGHGFYQPEYAELYHGYVLDFLNSHKK